MAPRQAKFPEELRQHASERPRCLAARRALRRHARLRLPRPHPLPPPPPPPHATPPPPPFPCPHAPPAPHTPPYAFDPEPLGPARDPANAQRLGVLSQGT